MKFSIKNMKFSIKNMKFSIYEICQNSSIVVFVTEFSYHMYRKNAVLNGKQKQMKPLQFEFSKLIFQKSSTDLQGVVWEGILSIWV